MMWMQRMVYTEALKEVARHKEIPRASFARAGEVTGYFRGRQCHTSSLVVRLFLRLGRPDLTRSCTWNSIVFVDFDTSLI